MSGPIWNDTLVNIPNFSVGFQVNNQMVLNTFLPVVVSFDTSAWSAASVVSGPTPFYYSDILRVFQFVISLTTISTGATGQYGVTVSVPDSTDNAESAAAFCTTDPNNKMLFKWCDFTTNSLHVRLVFNVIPDTIYQKNFSVLVTYPA